MKLLNAKLLRIDFKHFFYGILPIFHFHYSLLSSLPSSVRLAPTNAA